MKKGNVKIKFFTGVVFLLSIFILISPTTIGSTFYEQIAVEKKYCDDILEKLAFDCRDSFGYSSFENYKEKLLVDDNFVYNVVVEGYFGVVSDRIYKTSLQDPIEPIFSAGGLMNSSWPMKSHDTQHTGLSPYSTIHVDGLEKWRFYVDDWIDSAPVIDSDGVIYFGTKGGGYYAVYPNCTLKWNFEAPGWTWSAPAIAEDGTVYVTSYDCGLYAINPDGSQKWRFGSGGSISSSPVIDENGTIYFGTMGPDYDGRIYAVNPNGTEKWRYTTGFWIESDPAIGDDGTIYIGSGDTYFYALNPNGTLKWRYKTGDEIHGHATITEDGTIYISSFDNNLYAINPDGTEKWVSDADLSLSNNVAIGSDGTIYAGYHKMYAINPIDGSVIWSVDLGGEHWIGESSPCVSADGTIYVGTHRQPTGGGGDIIAFNPDGTIQWRKEISLADKGSDSSPCIGPDGTVYIGSAWHRGFLHAFGPVDSNEPPNAPSISGETNGEVGQGYWYTFKAIDPDNNPVTFYIDWGDGDEDWRWEWASGAPTYSEHTWSEEGNYTIRAKVKDTLGEESNWTYLEVTMPFNQQSHNYPFLDWIRGRFPVLYELIMKIDWFQESI